MARVVPAGVASSNTQYVRSDKDMDTALQHFIAVPGHCGCLDKITSGSRDYMAEIVFT